MVRNLVVHSGRNIVFNKKFGKIKIWQAVEYVFHFLWKVDSSRFSSHWFSLFSFHLFVADFQFYTYHFLESNSFLTQTNICELATYELRFTECIPQAVLTMQQFTRVS